MPILEIRNVTRRFGGLAAVHDVSLSIEAGEFFTLLGPSGCGKTTLLRMIAGFDLPDAGQILLDGKDLADTAPERRPIHTVFQSYALFPHMTVWQNIAFPLEMARRPPAEIRQRVAEALEQVHLADKSGHFPHELSGGQKQRVALARGLVNKPRLLLLDEPLGALDAKLREEMRNELIELQREIGVTFIFVTHSQQEALALSHRIAVMREGRVEQVDEPAKLYGLPRNRFVADFIGDINMMEAEVSAVVHGQLHLHIPVLGVVQAPPAANAKVGDRGVLALRPEQVRLTPQGQHHELANHFHGKVQSFIYLGDVTVYTVMLDNGASIEALAANNAPGRATFFKVGDDVAVAWRHDAGLFLDE